MAAPQEDKRIHRFHRRQLFAIPALGIAVIGAGYGLQKLGEAAKHTTLPETSRPPTSTPTPNGLFANERYATPIATPMVLGGENVKVIPLPNPEGNITNVVTIAPQLEASSATRTGPHINTTAAEQLIALSGLTRRTTPFRLYLSDDNQLVVPFVDLYSKEMERRMGVINVKLLLQIFLTKEAEKNPNATFTRQELLTQLSIMANQTAAYLMRRAALIPDTELAKIDEHKALDQEAYNFSINYRNQMIDDSHSKDPRIPQPFILLDKLPINMSTQSPVA